MTYILIKTYPQSPPLWSKVNLVDNCYQLNELRLDKELVEKEPNYWQKFPDFNLNDLITWLGNKNLHRVSAITDKGIMCNNAFMSNEDILKFQVRVCSNDEAILYFKQQLEEKEITLGSSILTESGDIFKLESIIVRNGEAYLNGQGKEHKADQCYQYKASIDEFLKDLNNPFWNSVKKESSKLYYLHVLGLIAKTLNRNWQPDWANGDQPKYCVRKNNNNIEAVSLGIPPYNYNYGVPVFKSLRLAQEAIIIMNGKLNYIYEG
jgi:hypothetical protein